MPLKPVGDHFGEVERREQEAHPGKQTTGTKTYDFNVDGLAHIGLLPDMIADLEVVGLDESKIEPLFRGAEAYVDMWDKAAGTFSPAPVANCLDRVVVADASCQATNISIAAAGVDDPRVVLQQQPTVFPVGSTATFLSVTDVCGAGGVTSCGATVTVVDQTPPTVSCGAPITAECVGGTATVAVPAPVASDNCSALASASCSAGPFPFGSSSSTCTATDTSGNSAQCSVAVNVVDTTPPVLNCPATLTAECGTAVSAPLPPATDSCFGTASASCSSAGPIGIGLVGTRSLMQTRLEKSFPAWGLELTPDYSAVDAGMQRFVKPDKGEFIGREAFLDCKPAAERFACFTVDAGDCAIWGDEAIFLDGEPVGYVTSGGFGPSCEQHIALGYVNSDAWLPEGSYSIEILGELRAAQLQTEPLYDPRGLRMRN